MRQPCERGVASRGGEAPSGDGRGRASGRGGGLGVAGAGRGLTAAREILGGAAPPGISVGVRYHAPTPVLVFAWQHDCFAVQGLAVGTAIKAYAFKRKVRKRNLLSIKLLVDRITIRILICSSVGGN